MWMKSVVRSGIVKAVSFSGHSQTKVLIIFNACMEMMFRLILLFPLMISIELNLVFKQSLLFPSKTC